MTDHTDRVTNPRTHFRLLRSGTPWTEDGYKVHELTGEVMCELCGHVAQKPEAIQHCQGCSDHPDGCPQAGASWEQWPDE